MKRILLYILKVTGCLLGLLLGVVLLFGIYWFYGYEKIKKPSVYAGFAYGSIVNYHLEVHTDSTFCLTKVGYIDDFVGNWSVRNDTLLLFYRGKIEAKIYKDTLIEYNSSVFKSLSIMRFKKFNPPERVTFPKD